MSAWRSSISPWRDKACCTGHIALKAVKIGREVQQQLLRTYGVGHRGGVAGQFRLFHYLAPEREMRQDNTQQFHHQPLPELFDCFFINAYIDWNDSLFYVHFAGGREGRMKQFP
jgi:hypothetical protein